MNGNDADAVADRAASRLADALLKQYRSESPFEVGVYGREERRRLRLALESLGCDVTEIETRQVLLVACGPSA